MATEPENTKDDASRSDAGSSDPTRRKSKKKKEKPPSRDGSENWETMTDFGLRRLFNPESTEFLPMDEQLKLYKHRDLTATKTYATATRVFGNPRVRRRIHVAPQMGESPGRSATVKMANADLQPQVDGRQRLKPINADNMVLTERDKQIIHDNEVQERMVEYKSWLRDRMALRAGLENMGLKESWLRSKPDPTPLERRVLAQLEEARRVALELKFQAYLTLHSPELKAKRSKKIKIKAEDPSEAEKKVKPQPEGMGILASYLSSRKQRLLDLFAQADKDKSWSITRDEFRKCIKEAKIPLSDVQLNELMDSLDDDDNAELDYREFVRGMDRFQLEERKRKILEEQSRTNLKMKSAPEVRTPSAASTLLSTVREVVSSPVVPTERSEDLRGSRTPDSLASLLEIPKIDITERRALSHDDLIEKRKRERYQSANLKKQKKLPRVIQTPLKTGNKAVDLHSQTSTLGGELSVEIHDYRAARLAEYHAILRLCEDREIPLTPRLLERALLHPGDKKVNQLKKRLRQPGTHTMSNKFAEPPKPPDSPTEFDETEEVVVTKSGEVLVDAKHVYPKLQELSKKPKIQNLSSGKAFINRKVDCWMSFEEYDRLTRHLKKRYISLESVSDHDVFWPGYMLDKVQLYMPETRCRDAIASHAVFQPTAVTAKRSNPGFNNDVSYWLVSDQNYLKSGGVDERKVYNIDWK